MGYPQAYRALFLIDRDGIVRHQLRERPAPGPPHLRFSAHGADALRHFEEHGETCPANWEADSWSFVIASKAKQSLPCRSHRWI
ncbi:MAG: hypothetical protein WKG07_47430 [Hymenobacter sp.]